MSILQSILLGIVQGLTEFLPVSSSGHLVILQNFFGIAADDNTFFEALLHVGTLTALFIAFGTDIRHLSVELIRILRDLFYNIRIALRNRRFQTNEAYRRIVHNNYRKFAAMILISAVPTAMLGVLSRHIVEAACGNLLAPGVGFLLTGMILLVVDRTKDGNRIPRDADWASAVWIGICQGLSVLPGISRSGMTIAAALLCGFSRKFAVKYSYIISIPAILGALIVEIGSLGGSDVTWKLGGVYFLGALFAALIGAFTIRVMLNIVRKKKLVYFAYYCFFIGIVSIAGNFLV